jgi:hypothetical protein
MRTKTLLCFRARPGRRGWGTCPNQRDGTVLVETLTVGVCGADIEIVGVNTAGLHR